MSTRNIVGGYLGLTSYHSTYHFVLLFVLLPLLCLLVIGKIRLNEDIGLANDELKVVRRERLRQLLESEYQQ